MRIFGKNLNFFIMFGAISMLLPTSYGRADTGAEIAKMCADYPNGDSPQLCELYVNSAVDFVTSDDRDVNPNEKLCIAQDTPRSELISQLNSWLSSHPELLSKSIYVATYDAFSQNYKCK